MEVGCERGRVVGGGGRRAGGRVIGWDVGPQRGTGPGTCWRPSVLLMTLRAVCALDEGLR